MTFFFVEESILYNYADDNTLSYSDTELNKVELCIKSNADLDNPYASSFKIKRS
jgi:hypothetical protein